MKKLLLIALLGLLSCEPKKNYNEAHPSFCEVSLLNNLGEIVETRYFHEKIESSDWGAHRNYEFRYWYWKESPQIQGWGTTLLQTWEWEKTSVRIKCN